MEMPVTHSKEPTQLQLLMTYAAELELEVDRLRRRDQFLQHEAWKHVRQLMRLGKTAGLPEGIASPLTVIAETCGQFSELLHDMKIEGRMISGRFVTEQTTPSYGWISSRSTSCVFQRACSKSSITSSPIRCATAIRPKEKSGAALFQPAR